MALAFLLVLVLTGVVLIILILVQRGKGGGLAGAFGGLGGQSAFGTKAGDTFTKITIGVASFWIVLCILGVAFIGVTTTKRMKLPGGEGAPLSAPGSTQAPSGTAPASPGPSSSAPASGVSGGAPRGAASGGASRPAGSGSSGGGS